VPALTLEWRSGEALIGPLTVPGQPTCGFCARARIAGAAASAPAVVDGDSSPSDQAAAVLADEVRAILAGPLAESRLLGHVVVWDAATDRTSLHRVIPMPWCPVCGGAAATSSPSEASVLSADLSPAELLGSLAGWVDRKTGIISRIGVDHAAAPVTMTAAPPHVQNADGSLRQMPIGWGKGLTISAAILSAVGETIERYSASLPDPGRIVWKRPSELDGEVLTPDAFSLYSAEQYARAGFPYLAYDAEAPHPWIAGRWFGSDAPVWVPAVMAYLSLTIRREHQIVQGTSNGLAAGRDLEDASRRAVMELVERDAFLAAWLTGRAGRRIVVNGALPEELADVLGAVKSYGATIELYLLADAAFGTAILALALGDGADYPGVTIGIGADLDPHIALRQAILELGQTGPHLRRMMRTRTAPVPAEPAAVRDMLDHAAFYFRRKHAAAFDRIRGAEAPIALADLPRSADDAAGLRIAVVDVTSPDVALSPFRVARAVSPDLQPISYGYGFDRPPVERIRRLGLAADVPPVHPIW
jgi:ribosomal protein S12 methylthiotransferase accessory factor